MYQREEQTQELKHFVANIEKGRVKTQYSKRNSIYRICAVSLSNLSHESQISAISLWEIWDDSWRGMVEST